MCPARSLVLALDLGTSASKVGLFAVDGTAVSLASREQRLEFPAPGRVEQSPEETWNLLADAVGDALRRVDPTAVRAVALCGQRGTVVPLARDGTALAPLVVWMDKRGVSWARWLAETIGKQRYYQLCGHPIVSYTGVSKLLWFQREAAGLFERAAVVGPPQTLALAQLGADDLVCDQSTGTFLFPFDIDSKRWSASLAAAMGFPLDKLPRLVTAVTVVGELRKAAAERLGLPPGIPLVAGAGDGQAAGVGSGVTRPGRVMVNVGTGAGVQRFLPSPVRDPGYTLNLAAHADPAAWEMEGHTQASGAALRWFRDQLGRTGTAAADSYDRLIEEIGPTVPGARGLLFLPTLNGSSAPEVDLLARGCLLGLTLAHTRADVIRAVLEGISLELRWMLDAMTNADTTAEDIRLVGGGARNPIWNRLHASVFGRPVRTLRSPEAALAGTAMCATVAIGEHSSLDEAAERFVRVREVFEPDPVQADTYELVYDNYRAAFRSLSGSGIFQRLREQEQVRHG